MRKRIAFCLVAVLLASPAFAQSLADRVPGDAIFYVGWKGTGDLGPGYAQSHLKAMVDASNINELLHKTIPQLITKYGGINPQVEQALHVLDAVVAPMWQHPSALYIGKLQLANGQVQPPHVLLLCKAGAGAAELQTELQNQLQQLPVPVPTNVSTIGDVVVLAIDYQPNEVQLPSGHDGQSLAENAAFRSAFSEVGSDPVLAGYLDIAALVAFGDQAVATEALQANKEQWQRFRDQAGLAGLKQVAFSSGFDGREWGTRLFVGAPEPRTGALAQWSTKPLPEALLQTIPRGAAIAGAAHLDLAKIVDSLRNGNPDVAQQFDGGMNMVSQIIGVDVQKELLPTFGDEWAFYVDPATAGYSMSGLAVINRLHDPATAQATLEKFQAGVAKFAAEQLQGKPVTIAFKKVMIGTTEVNYLAMPLITPAWAVQGDYLCMGLYPQVVASAAAHIARQDKSILDNKDFLALRKRLGGEDASSFEFMDLRAIAPQGYASWRAIGSVDQIADILGVNSPPALIPTLDQMMAHLSSAGQVSYVDAKGFHFRSITPFPAAEILASDPSSMSVGETALMTSILLPALNRAREQANRVKSASNLKQIGLGALMYANEHNGRYPASLGELVAKEDLTAQVFVNPRASSPSPPPGLAGEELANWVNQHSDYVWLGRGKTNNLPADSVLAYEKFDGLTDGINILYGDGHVEFQTMPVARRQIENAGQSHPELPKNGGL